MPSAGFNSPGGPRNPGLAPLCSGMSATPVPEGGKPAALPRQLTLKYDGVCAGCGRALPKGVQALYDFSTHKARCLVCETDDAGVAGASAQREFERRRAVRQSRVARKLTGILDQLQAATSVESPTTLAWERGAIGERKLAETLARLPNAKLLHDRRVPHTRGNLDHIVVAPAGVFVVDAKLYRGLIQIRRVWGLLGGDERLFVGGRNRTHIAENMDWQVAAVQRALSDARFWPPPPIVPVVCFVDGEWPWSITPPHLFRGVWLEDASSILRFMSGKPVHAPEVVARIHHTLAVSFPPK